jgi:hypothetical protein
MKREQFFTLKIESYEKQDKKAGRVIDTVNFIDIPWFVRELTQHKECQLCHTPYYGELEDGRFLSNISADRIDNSICHTKENCRLMCVDCNKKRSDKNNLIFA